MKYYIVTATINQKLTYMEYDHDTGNFRMSERYVGKYDVCLFLSREAALTAIDSLRHGIGKLCKIQVVTLSEEQPI